MGSGERVAAGGWLGASGRPLEAGAGEAGGWGQSTILAWGARGY